MKQRLSLLKTAFQIILPVFILGVMGCSGGKLPPAFEVVQDGGESSVKKLPTELREKFEIVDDTKPEVKLEVVGEGKIRPPKKKIEKKINKTFSYPNRRPKIDPIWIGEKQVFEITYIGLAAGDVSLEVLPHKTIHERKVYHIRGNAKSSSIFSLIYRLDDTIQTFIDFEGIFSHRFHLLLDETKQTRDALELYDSEKKEAFYWNKWKHIEKQYIETKETFPMPPFPQDSLSALYYVRTLPLKDGELYQFPVISEGKALETEVQVVRREIMDTPIGRIQTVVVKPETKFHGIAQKRGDSFIWYSDDDRRVLLRIEAKVKIGTVVARLKSFQPGTPP